MVCVTSREQVAPHIFFVDGRTVGGSFQSGSREGAVLAQGNDRSDAFADLGHNEFHLRDKVFDVQATLADQGSLLDAPHYFALDTNLSAVKDPHPNAALCLEWTPIGDRKQTLRKMHIFTDGSFLIFKDREAQSACSFVVPGEDHVGSQHLLGFIGDRVANP